MTLWASRRQGCRELQDEGAGGPRANGPVSQHGVASEELAEGASRAGSADGRRRRLSGAGASPCWARRRARWDGKGPVRTHPFLPGAKRRAPARLPTATRRVDAGHVQVGGASVAARMLAEAAAPRAALASAAVPWLVRARKVERGVVAARHFAHVAGHVGPPARTGSLPHSFSTAFAAAMPEMVTVGVPVPVDDGGFAAAVEPLPAGARVLALHQVLSHHLLRSGHGSAVLAGIPRYGGRGGHFAAQDGLADARDGVVPGRRGTGGPAALRLQASLGVERVRRVKARPHHGEHVGAGRAERGVVETDGDRP